MKPTTTNTYTEENMFNIKRIHMDKINRVKRQIQYCEWFIAASVGASIVLIGIIVHMMVTGPSWTW
jgi:hypothetical protein